MSTTGWRITLPDPPVSECLGLIQAARAGDAYAVRRCRALFHIKLPRAKNIRRQLRQVAERKKRKEREAAERKAWLDRAEELALLKPRSRRPKRADA